MCGIVGIISKQPVDLSVLKSMNDKIIHRGPDGYGYLASAAALHQEAVDHLVLLEQHAEFDYALGHQRLAIHDLSQAGHQPMSYQDRYSIVFNGEIYNFLELKAELSALGYQFKSNTDTEVIMAAYDYWGSECLSKFNGMWAFVLLDLKAHKIFIARDRFGIKPLYYFAKDGLLVFASEIKALLEHPAVPKEPNYNYLAAYMQNGPREYIKETAFAGIYRFDFAHYFLGDIKEVLIPQQIHLQRYWQLRPNLKRARFNKEKAKDYAQQYYTLLKDAVRLRLRADVKIGSALSGGLDSSSVVYLINQIIKEAGQNTERQETFSSVYKSPGTEQCDESNYINIMAEKLGVRSNQIEPQPKNIPDQHLQMIYAMENPPESTCMSGWHVFKLVADSDITITLDGQGADEILAGYLGYLLNYFVSISLIEVPLASIKFWNIPGARKLIIAGVAFKIIQTFLGVKALKWSVKTFLKRDFEPNLNAILVKDVETSLVNLLHYLDHTSMHFSLESRMPFMDYRLVEFLASVPATYKIHDGWTKYLARLAFDGKLPDEICWRRDKMGWPIPENFWFKGELKNWFIAKTQDDGFWSRLGLAFDPEKSLASNNKIWPIIRYLNLRVYFDTFFNTRAPS